MLRRIDVGAILFWIEINKQHQIYSGRIFKSASGFADFVYCHGKPENDVTFGDSSSESYGGKQKNRSSLTVVEAAGVDRNIRNLCPRDDRMEVSFIYSLVFYSR